jgi:hypothetical protein
LSNSRRQTRGILHRDELDVEAHLGVVVGICSLLLFAAVCCRLLFCCCCRVVHVLNMSLVLAARARALRLRGEAVWYSTRRAARLVSRVCRDPRPVSLRQSPTRPRDMTMSRMWGGGPTRVRLVRLVGLCRRKMCYGGRDATRPTCTVCEGEDARLVRLVRLVGLCRPKMSHTADATRPRL